MRRTISDLVITELAQKDDRGFPEMRLQRGSSPAGSGYETSNRSAVDILTIQDVAAYLRLPTSTVYRLVQWGELPGHKVGRHWRFHRKTLEDWFRVGAESWHDAHQETKNARE